ncbi:MAG: PilZ domain-containing protein [Candidatus Omnitrophota bacterium]
MQEDNLTKDLERRNSVRLNEELPVTIRFSNSDTQYKAITKNIAKDGLCLKTQLPEKLISDNLYLNIDIPEARRSINFDGKVIWQDCQSFDNLCWLGIRFLDNSSQAKNLLQEYILRKLNFLTNATVLRPLVIRDIYSDLSEKERRNLNMLDTIRRRGPISKAEIAKIVNLNIGTISNYIEDYIKKQIIFDKGFDISSGGRRPSLLELNEQFAYTIGVATNGFINVCLIDAKGNIINKLKQEVKENTKYEETKKLIDELIMTSKVNNALIKGVGLVKDRQMNDCSSLLGVIESKFKSSVFVVEESSACVFAEYWVNYDLTDFKNIIYLSLDDFSCGLILNRELYCYKEKRPIDNNIVKDMILNSKDSDFKNRDVLLNFLFLRLINIVDLLNPDLIIIGGLLPDAGSIINSLKEKMQCLPDVFKYIKIISSSLSEYQAGIGAAGLVMKEVFIQS